MLQPKITKYRKSQKGRIKGLATRGSVLDKGDYGLKVLESARISARQIEAIKLTITRTIKRQGKMWLRIFPSKPITKKPAEVRMGKGKGAPEYWAAEVKPGRIIFELGGIPAKSALEAFRLAAAKLQVRTKVVTSKFVS